jgi:Uncharacterized protein with SCP/PR1 domains
MRIIFLILILTITNKVFAQSDEKLWPAELNTAKDAHYLEELEREIVHELNKVRSNPKRYAEEYLEELASAYSGMLFTYPGQETLRSKEGIAPLLECIQVLKSTNPTSTLNPAKGLTQATEDLLNDQQKYGGIGHITRNGQTPQKRMDKYGEWNICSAEDISYGNSDARQIIISLLIDDGVPERSHRKNVLNPCFHFVGVAFGKHPSYLTMGIIDYSGEYKNRE